MTPEEHLLWEIFGDPDEIDAAELHEQTVEDGFFFDEETGEYELKVPDDPDE